MENQPESAQWALSKMQQRQSVRSFTDQPIPADLLREILKAGINSATGGNLQPYSILVEQDPARKQRLAALCGEQPFIAQAAVDLVFLLDWHKLAVYSRSNDAPLECHKSIDHFLIALEDLVCAAQTVESAAWLHGIGSCYVGTVLNAIPEVAQMYNLPKLTCPMLLLSLGYPKGLTKPRKKLAYEMVVFEGSYPEMSSEQVCAAYDEKYKGMRTALPAEPARRQAFLEEFLRALRVTYTEEKSQAIAKEANEAGSIKEIQRRFGLHYHTADMLTPAVLDAMAEQGIYPFFSLWGQA